MVVDKLLWLHEQSMGIGWWSRMEGSGWEMGMLGNLSTSMCLVQPCLAIFSLRYHIRLIRQTEEKKEKTNLAHSWWTDFVSTSFVPTLIIMQQMVKHITRINLRLSRSCVTLFTYIPTLISGYLFWGLSTVEFQDGKWVWMWIEFYPYTNKIFLFYTHQWPHGLWTSANYC